MLSHTDVGPGGSRQQWKLRVSRNREGLGAKTSAQKKIGRIKAKRMRANQEPSACKNQSLTRNQTYLLERQKLVKQESQPGAGKKAPP